MNRLYKPILVITWLLLLGAFTSTSFGQLPVTPPPGATGVLITTPSVSWTHFGVPAPIYNVEFNGTDGTYLSSVSSSISTPGTSLPIPSLPLVNNTTYYWRVNDATLNPFPSPLGWFPYSFTTEIATPVITNLAGSPTGVSLTPTIDWTFAGGTAGVTFDVEYSSDNFSTIFTEASGLAGTITSHSFGTTLTNNTGYKIRVVAKKGGEPDKTSNAPDFTTLIATPVITNLVGSPTGVVLDPTIDWTFAGGETGVTFDVQYSTDNFVSDINTDASGSGLAGSTRSHTFTTILAPNTTYKVRVVAKKTGESDKPSTGTEFTTIAPATLTAPVNGLTGVSIEPNFTWTDIFGEASYELRISTSDTDTSSFNAAVVLTKTGLTANSVAYQLLETDITSPPFDNSKLLYWMISVRDAKGNKINSDIYHFTTYPDLNPTLLWPTDGLTISGENVTFSWYISTSIGSLKFYLQHIQQTAAPDASDWASSSTTETGTSDLFKTITSFVGGLDYHWRVIVKDGSDIVDYSAVNSFTTNGGTSVTITPSWPVGGVTVYSNNPTLNWYPSLYVPGLKYRVRYGTSSTLTNAGGGPNDSLATGTSLDYTTDLFTDFPSDLTPGTTYYWQVRIYDPATLESGTWSSVVSFVTNGSGTLVVPVPSYPLGGVTVYTTQPTLSWYIGTSGLGLVYDVEIKESTVDFDGTPTHNDVTTLFKLSDPLTPGKSYHWRVRSDNGTTESDWSTLVVSGGAEFTVSGGITAAVPVAIWPVGNVSVFSTTPTLSWTVPGSVLGITGYNVRYSTTNYGSSDVTDWTSFNPGGAPGTNSSTEGKLTGITDLFKLLTTALDYGEHYYWVVTSVDATGESVPTSSSVGEFTITGGTSSGTPTLLFPADASTVYNKKPTFSWYVSGSSNGITGYELVYSTSDVFDPSVTTTETTTGTSFTPSSDLTPGSNYYWKVRSTYASLPSSSFSPVFVFTVNPGAAPIQPILGGPTDNLVVPTSEPTLAWKVNAEPNASMTYELEFADNENMQNSSVISDITTTYQKVSGLSNDKNYYWRVRSKNADGSYSEYSGKGKFYAKFSVTAVDNELVIPQKFTVEQNYPNPFNPSTIIRFALPEASFVTLKIYNMLGQEVKILVNGQKNAGTFNVQWRGDNDFGQKVSSGTYIYRIIAGQNIFTKKMILLK